MKNNVKAVFAGGLLIFTFAMVGPAFSKPKAKNLYRYVDSVTQLTRTTFNLHKTKFGIFWGPCGPVPGNLGWSYDFDMSGEGPEFSWDKVVIKKSGFGAELALRKGQVLFDEKGKTVTVELIVLEKGREVNFVGNGKHKVKEKKDFFR